MNTARWQHIREVLDQAISLSADKRSAYLSTACAGDQELQVEVESLLRSHEWAGDRFLNTPVVDLRSLVPDADGRPSYIGRRIGVYKVIEEIGRGGMGEVYRASRVDGHYDKQVAIKLVRVGLDTPSLLERFRTERQILASLDHPNIARLLDGGTTEDGIPYLLMELIEGTQVDQYSDQHSLGLTERLQLFIHVCAAVQFAHQRLVIHRDIKPSNILVTEDGVPKLLDFGIAKILDPSGGRETTMFRPMTPEYASPEQIRGESITTATDVYSLGVILYRLLTSKSPYPETARTPHELAQLICEAELRRPSSAVLRAMNAKAATDPQSRRGAETPAKLNKRLRGDLDNIVLKSLRKESARRYASVEQFAEDIRRHLAGLPVTATPDSLAYRASKFVRRHKLGMAGSVLIVLSVAGGVATTIREARIASANERRAERRFNDVRKLADSFLFEFDDAIEYLPGSTPARSLVVRRALEYLEGLAAEASGDRSLQMEIASAYKKVGKVQGDPIFPNLGDSNGALQSFRKALAILEPLSRADPKNEDLLLALASTHQQISDVLNFSGDTSGAVEHSGTALKMYEALAGNLANDSKFQTARVTETYHYANLLQSVGALEESAAEYKRAAELSQRMIAASPKDPEGKVHLATSLDGLGYVLLEKGDSTGALENFGSGLTLREELARLDPDNSHYRRQLAFSHQNVGLSLEGAGNLSTALSHFRQELSLFEALSAADPKDAQARRNRSLACKMVGDVLMRRGEFRGALARYRTALGVDRELAAADPNNSQAALDLSFSESKAGSALGKLGDSPEALALLRGGIAGQESLLAKDPHHVLLYSHLANSYTSLAKFLLDNAQTKASIEYYRKAIAARLTLSERSPNNSANRTALAECYTNLAKALGPSNREDALKQSNNAVELLERLAAADRSNTQFRLALGTTLLNAARLHVRIAEHDEESSVRLQDWTKAREFYQRSQELLLQLDRTGKLPPRSRVIQEVSGELARCANLLAKPEQVH